MQSFEKLYKLVDAIVGPSGCMWSQKQRMQTLLPYLIEESYEVIEAVEKEDKAWIQEEMGDLLFVTFFLIYLANRDFGIDLGSMVEDVCEKIERRHPHVFGSVKVESMEDIARNWEKIKQEEKKHRKSITTGVPKHLSALLRAAKFFDKLRLKPLPFFIDKAPDLLHLSEEEIGEQILTLTYVAHKKGIDAEGAVRRATKRHLEK
ncbi:hypothetical protein COB21_00035 [Candidatus Aerophobetes bacterium]|uniref:NTP pyrophosphohydrolase MazG-like domain-containing protein n=1 Tax=Aerophobetes bacterium TaxID=2030807 RepID=A0A2A4X7Y7_UNCAE|nr:MAG: hypothetical protein COB21_00035 [Candidatus Aerophobetes bacterium]